MKKVRFHHADSLCTVISDSSIPSILSNDDIQERWYSEDDYSFVEFDINNWAMKLQKNGQDKILNQVLPRDGHESLIDSSDIMPHLLEWAKLESCRGLETQLNLTHKIQRSKQRAKATYTTLRTQAAWKDRPKQEDRAEKIREESEKCTESAKQFAHAMALADEKVLQLDLIRQPAIPRKVTILHRLFPKRMQKNKT